MSDNPANPTNPAEAHLAYCRDLALTRVREMGQRDADQRAGRWGAGRAGDQAGARQGYVRL